MPNPTLDLCTQYATCELCESGGVRHGSDPVLLMLPTFVGQLIYIHSDQRPGEGLGEYMVE
jgi:hypothetical protein